LEKVNCWEFKKCGREIGGMKSQILGVCPVVKNHELEGTHGGKSAGRACWIVAGSMCGGAVQGTFADKYSNCRDCDFYKLVRKEEGFSFQLSPVLLSKYKKG
jgi:hypothetical protein